MTDTSGMPDLNGLLGQAMAMQQKLQEAQAQAAAATFEGAAGGGVVRVEVSGTGEFHRVHIDPSVIDASDPSMLEDLVLAAIHDAAARVAQAQAASMESITGGGLSGLGIPGLG